MNEPANFVDGDVNKGCARNKWNNPPYMTSKCDLELCVKKNSVYLAYEKKNEIIKKCISYNDVEDRSGRLIAQTLCLDIEDSVSRHYVTHSLYGWFQSEPTAA